MISCSHDVWIPILDTYIEYPGMTKLPIMMQNVIKTHVNHHFVPVVETYYSHNVMFVHLRHAIKYGLLLGWITLQTSTPTTLDMILVLSERPVPRFFDVTQQPTSPSTVLNGFACRLCHKYYFLFLMVELVHMYDVWNEPILDQNFSCSIQNCSIVWPSSYSDWWQ